MGGVALLLNQPLRNSRQRCFGDWEIRCILAPENRVQPAGGSSVRLRFKVCVAMQRVSEKRSVEPGMKVSVRRSNRDHIGVVTRLTGEYVVVRWTQSDLDEIEEYQAHRDDVTPLAGWL